MHKKVNKRLRRFMEYDEMDYMDAVATAVSSEGHALGPCEYQGVHPPEPQLFQLHHRGNNNNNNLFIYSALFNMLGDQKRITTINNLKTINTIF